MTNLFHKYNIMMFYKDKNISKKKIILITDCICKSTKSQIDLFKLISMHYYSSMVI